MLAYKSSKNLKSFLVSAKLPSLDCTIETTPTSNLRVEYTPISSIETNNEDRQSWTFVIIYTLRIYHFIYHFKIIILNVLYLHNILNKH